MHKLIIGMLIAAFMLTSGTAFAEDDDEEEADQQVIDFGDELDVDGERNEADLYREEPKREADFGRMHKVEKKSFMGGGGGDSDDADEADNSENSDDSDESSD